MVMGSKKQHNLWGIITSLSLTILIVFILSRIFAIIMISPDDIAFELILSGNMSGTPDGHAYFLQYPLGAALAFLYGMHGGISWYKLFLLGSLAWSFFLIFARVSHVAAGRKILYLGTAVLLVVLLFSENVVHLEWTVIAGVLGATAIFRFITMPPKLSRWGYFCEYAVCTVLLILCFCLRNTVAYMFIPLAGICWLRKLLETLEKTGREEKKKVVQLIAFLVVCLVLVGAVMVTHAVAYSSEDWQAYKDYTKDRSALFDYYGYPDYETYAEEYQAAGISYEAYVLMRSDYNYIVPCDNFKEMDLKAIADLAREIHTEDLETKMKSVYQTIRDILVGEKYALLNFVIVVLITCNLCIYKETKVIDVVYVAVTVCWAMAFYLYLAYDGRLPERVVKSIDYGLIMALLGNCISQWTNVPTKIKLKIPAPQKVLSVILAVVMLGTITAHFGTLHKENEKKENLAISYRQILKYCATYPENMYLRDFGAFSQRGDLFMNDVKCDNYASSGGWAYHTPVYDELLEKWDCVDFCEAVKENGNIYYLVSEGRYKKVLNNLNGYFVQENLPILMETVDTFKTVNETVVVMKFSYQES